MQNEVLVVSADPNLIFGEEDVDLFRNFHLYFHHIRIVKKEHQYIALYLPAEFKNE